MTATEADAGRVTTSVVADGVVRCLEGGSGPRVVVLHHSFGAVGWGRFEAGLSGDFSVLAPDLPGFGESGRPAWARDVRDLALLVGWWLRGLGGGEVTVVGCGFGGWVAAELVTMCPELVSDLVLVGSAGLLPESGRILDQVLISHSEYVRAAFSSTEAYEPVFTDELSDELLLPGTEIGRWWPGWHGSRICTTVGWFRCCGSVEVPALVVWGAMDRVVPLECGEALCPVAAKRPLGDGRRGAGTPWIWRHRRAGGIGARRQVGG